MYVKYFSPIFFFLGAFHAATALCVLWWLRFFSAQKLCSSFHFGPFEWMRNNFSTYTSGGGLRPTQSTANIHCVHALYFNFRSSNACTVHDSGQKMNIFCFYFFYNWALKHVCVCVLFKLVAARHMRASSFMWSAESFYGLRRQTYIYCIILPLIGMCGDKRFYTTNDETIESSFFCTFMISPLIPALVTLPVFFAFCT